MAISRWINIQELEARNGIFWLHPILGALNVAVSNRICRGMTENELELSTYILIKLKIIKRIRERAMNEQLKFLKIVKEKYNERNINTLDFKAVALDIMNEDLKYNLISDIESYVLQVDACWDKMKELTIILKYDLFTSERDHTHKKTVVQYINEIHPDQESTAWISLLAGYRNFFTHCGAAYIAIDVTSANTDDWNLLIKKNMKDKFDDPKDFFPFSDLERINLGFSKSIMLLKQNLISIFQQPNQTH